MPSFSDGLAIFTRKYAMTPCRLIKFSITEDIFLYCPNPSLLSTSSNTIRPRMSKVSAIAQCSYLRFSYHPLLTRCSVHYSHPTLQLHALHYNLVTVHLEETLGCITAYRCHPFAVLCGGIISSVVGKLLGHQIGMSKGKDGSMHIFTPSFFGGAMVLLVPKFPSTPASPLP